MGHSRSIGPASASCCVWHSARIFGSGLVRGFHVLKDLLHLSPYAEGIVVLLLMGLHDAGQDFHACILRPVLLNEPCGNTLRIVFHERSPPVSIRRPHLEKRPRRPEIQRVPAEFPAPDNREFFRRIREFPA
jgi:hypothetical protein